MQLRNSTYSLSFAAKLNARPAFDNDYVRAKVVAID